ncbi:acylphosphatase [Baekduia soli]|uniref:acylphosphatase n=1 Tax=Baekduia soli TaxID=496014 RepID=A0A5B8U6M9_9ACTN|nr:acylphosphatase [Baekduia soli]QEC48660.1 acylphosphatase [Baekduia soli]
MHDVVARSLVVRGRVQGVNYRAWLGERARARGVQGWAANAADGSVEVWLQGAADAVAQVERAARQGPPWGSVDSVQATDADPREVDGFQRR